MNSATHSASQISTTEMLSSEQGRVFPRPAVLIVLGLLCPAMALAVAGIGAVRLAWRRSAVATVSATLAISILTGLGAQTQIASSTALPIVRTVAVAPFSLPALAWGISHGGELHYVRGLVAVTGLESGYGSRGVLTVGHVTLTGKSVDQLDEALLRHELRHTTQWAYLGGIFPVFYYLSEVAGGGPEGNVFEVNADLEDGNYVTESGTASG